MIFSLLLSLLLHPLHPTLPDGPISCQVQVRFSPRGGVADLLIQEIDRAQERIRIALYGLNNSRIVDALICAKERGVDVVLKLDKTQSGGKNQKAMIQRLRAAGVTAHVSHLSRLLHNKFVVIDGRRAWTGSYNFTTQAEERWRENIVILDCPEGANLFEGEWGLIEVAP